MFTVWKKAIRLKQKHPYKWEYVIIEMRCTQLVSSYGTNKCRAPWVDVIAISYARNQQEHHTAERAVKDAIWRGIKCDIEKYEVGDVVSWWDHTKWSIGNTVRPDSFDKDLDTVCTNGIHCFLTRQEAEEYCI